MSIVPPNVVIRKAERPTRFNRASEPVLSTVHERFPARLERRRRVERGPTGDFLRVDGTLDVEPAWVLRPGDILTVEAEAGTDQWDVLDMTDESIDLSGRVVMRSYGLQKKIQSGSRP